MCPRRGSNAHCSGFKPAASASWATRAGTATGHPWATRLPSAEGPRIELGDALTRHGFPSRCITALPSLQDGANQMLADHRCAHNYLCAMCCQQRTRVLPCSTATWRLHLPVPMRWTHCAVTVCGNARIVIPYSGKSVHDSDTIDAALRAANGCRRTFLSCSSMAAWAEDSVGPPCPRASIRDDGFLRVGRLVISNRYMGREYRLPTPSCARRAQLHHPPW